MKMQYKCTKDIKGSNGLAFTQGEVYTEEERMGYLTNNQGRIVPALFLCPHSFVPVEGTKNVSSIPTEEPGDDPVNHPVHYESMNAKLAIECIDAMRAAFGDYEVSVWCKLNSFKYIWRADSKGGNIDIGKAQWYLDKFLELGGCDQ